MRQKGTSAIIECSPSQRSEVAAQKRGCLAKVRSGWTQQHLCFRSVLGLLVLSSPLIPFQLPCLKSLASQMDIPQNYLFNS